MKDIGDRMKHNYEDRSRHYLTRRTPVIIRVDGRAFHTLTKGFKRPFDNIIEQAMHSVASALIKEAQGAKLAYWQSDEVSVLLTDFDTLTTGAWFDYNIQKICSVSASVATAAFNRLLSKYNTKISAQFDARAFNVPLDEVANYFLWRAKDWHRNSVTMYAQSFFSHKELHGMSVADMHEMLHDIGKNWTTDVEEIRRNGLFLVNKDGHWLNCVDIQPTYEDINELVKLTGVNKESRRQGV
jgi:tRNA(His) 5'-end guanylyltransferase